MLINNGYRSQPALHDFQKESAATKMKTSSLPDELYQHGDTSMYEKQGRGQITKKMTKKGLEYHISLMKEKRQKIYSRLLRKCGVIEDLLSSNMIAVEEEMLHLNDMLKLLMPLHRAYGTMLSEEEQMENDDWFDLVDEEVIPFKRKVNLWLKKVKEDQRSCTISEGSHSNGSFKKSVKSNVTKTSASNSRSSGSKARVLEEKAKLAELEAEEAFLVRRQMAENGAENLKIQ